MSQSSLPDDLPRDPAPVLPDYAGSADRGVVESVGEHDAAAGDVVDALSAEHRKLEGVFTEVQGLLDAHDEQGLRLRWGGIVREVLEHLVAEQRVVLPAVEGEPVAQVQEATEQLVQRLRGQDELTSQASPDEVRQAVQAIRQHVRSLDEQVLPLLQALPADARMRLGEDLRQVAG